MTVAAYDRGHPAARVAIIAEHATAIVAVAHAHAAEGVGEGGRGECEDAVVGAPEGAIVIGADESNVAGRWAAQVYVRICACQRLRAGGGGHRLCASNSTCGGGRQVVSGRDERHCRVRVRRGRGWKGARNHVAAAVSSGAARRCDGHRTQRPSAEESGGPRGCGRGSSARRRRVPRLSAADNGHEITPTAAVRRRNRRRPSRGGRVLVAANA